MTKKTRRAPVSKERATDFSRVGEDFFQAGELARETDYHSAAGLLYVHAAIAFADAVAIRLSGQRSTSERHHDAVTLLREVTDPKLPHRDEALNHLGRLIDVKSRIAYTGEILKPAGVQALAKHAERFRLWARDLLGR